MFGNAAAAASLVHAGLSAGGLSDHLAGLEACASLGSTGFGINTSGSNLAETTSALVGLATSSVVPSGRIGNHPNGAICNPSISSNNSQYNNSNPYSVHQNQTTNNNPYHQAASIYHNNYTSAAISSLGYHDSISNSYAGLAYPGVNSNHTSHQQRLFSSPSLVATSPSINLASDSILSEGNTLASSLLTSASSSISDKDSEFSSKLRKESNYSPPNSSSSFLPSSTVKIKTGMYKWIIYCISNI